MKITTRFAVGDRYRRWFIHRDGKLFASFGYGWMANNSGGFFARNRGSSPVHITVHVGDTEILSATLDSAKYMKDADKIAREWFRENNIRGLLRDRALSGEVPTWK